MNGSELIDGMWMGKGKDSTVGLSLMGNRAEWIWERWSEWRDRERERERERDRERDSETGIKSRRFLLPPSHLQAISYWLSVEYSIQAPANSTDSTARVHKLVWNYKLTDVCLHQPVRLQTLDFFYRGLQRNDRELHHMVQRQSCEAQYQQNQWACGGLLLYVSQCVKCNE